MRSGQTISLLSSDSLKPCCLSNSLTSGKIWHKVIFLCADPPTHECKDKTSAKNTWSPLAFLPMNAPQASGNKTCSLHFKITGQILTEDPVSWSQTLQYLDVMAMKGLITLPRTETIWFHTVIWFQVSWPTVITGDPKATFSIATSLRGRGGRNYFLLVDPLALDPFRILLSVMEEAIKPQVTILNKKLFTITWYLVLKSTTNNSHTVVWFQVFLSTTTAISEIHPCSCIDRLISNRPM